VTHIPPEHTAARALEDSFRMLGQERKRTWADTRQPWRHVSRRLPRAAVTALTGLMLVAVAATGTKVFVGDGGQLPPDPAGAKGHLAPAPAYRQLAQAVARDPIDHRPWGLRTFKSAGGETCLALGRVVGTRLGVVHVGQFKELPTRKGGVCGPLASQHMVMSSRNYFDSAIDGGRTALYGIVDRSITKLGLYRATGRGTAVPIAPDGTFIVVRTGTAAFAHDRLVAEGSAGRQVRAFGP
jgi:hypothetical protein